MVLSVPALSLCRHQRRVPFFYIGTALCTSEQAADSAIAVLRRSLPRCAFAKAAPQIQQLGQASKLRRFTGASLAKRFGA